MATGFTDVKKFSTKVGQLKSNEAVRIISYKWFIIILKYIEVMFFRSFAPKSVLRISQKRHKITKIKIPKSLIILIVKSGHLEQK